MKKEFKKGDLVRSLIRHKDVNFNNVLVFLKYSSVEYFGIKEIKCFAPYTGKIVTTWDDFVSKIKQTKN